MADEADREQQPRSRRDVEAQIIARAWDDESFAAELRANPREAIANLLGRELPNDLTIVIHEETLEDKTWHLAIPPKPVDELSDDELDAAAGGWGPGPRACWTLSG